MLDLQYYVGRLKFLNDAFEAEGGFISGEYIDRYARESQAKYDSRKKVSDYINHIAPISNNFIGYLTKRPPTREVLHPLIEAFVDDSDYKGNSLEVFMSGFLAKAKAKGCSLLLVDMPKASSDNLANQFSDRFFPYLVELNPEDLSSYELNIKGQLSMVEVNSTMTINTKVEKVIRGWDSVNWWVKFNNAVVEQGQHNLGVCPVLIFTEGNSFPYVGSFAQIADLSKRVYNLGSELSEMMRGQTFSILTLQIPADQIGQLDVATLSECVGVNNLLVYQGTQAPSFATPDSGPAATYETRLAALESNIKTVGHVIDFSGNAESGVALNIRFQSLNAALTSFARRAEDFERRLFSIISRWLGIQDSTTVSYSKSFELIDLMSELSILNLYKSNEFPDEVIRAKQKQIVSNDFSNLPASELQTLLDAVDTVDAETSLLESRLSVLEAGLSASDTSTDTANDGAGNDLVIENQGA